MQNKFFVKKNLTAYILFEIVIVIAIIVALIGLSVKFVAISDSAFVMLELERLYAYCFYLQKQANINQKEQYLIFDIKNNCYVINNHKIKLDKRVKIDFINAVKGPPSAPDSLISKPITFKDNKIIFYPDGVISSGMIYLTDKNKKNLYALSCAVGQLSYLRLYKYENTWKLVR